MIKNLSNLAVMALWFVILWLKYKELTHQVQEQLEMVTKEVVQGKRGSDLDMCLSVMDQELRKVEDALTQYNTWSTDLAAIALRTKIDTPQQARVSLVPGHSYEGQSLILVQLYLWYSIACLSVCLSVYVNNPPTPSLCCFVCCSLCSFSFPPAQCLSISCKINSLFIWTSPLSGVPLTFANTTYHMHAVHS